jgi:hypothetical protein
MWLRSQPLQRVDELKIALLLMQAARQRFALNQVKHAFPESNTYEKILAERK